MPKVKVACRVVNGIRIKRFKAGYDDGTGKQPLTADGPGITLAGPSALHAGAGNPHAEGAEPGITLVDKEWVEGWLEENKQTQLVDDGFVAIVPDSEVPDEGPPVAASEDPSAPKAFDQDFSDTIGGYPAGAIVASKTEGVYAWVSEVDGNVTDPDTDGAAGWVAVDPPGIVEAS
jgi:hypothetical protein